MPELKDRLRALELIDSPDLRERIRGWEPPPLRRMGVARRLGVTLLAFAVGAFGLVIAIRAFRASERERPQPFATPANGMIAFSAGADGDVFVVRPDGSGFRKLTDRHASGQEGGLQAVWSPDGATLAFTDYRSDGTRGLYLVAAEGGDPVEVSVGITDADSPAWSPDGGEMAFTGFDRSGYEIYVVKADGTNLRRLTDERDNGVDGAHMPAWSSDGTRIAYSLTRYDAASQTETHGIAFMGAAGGEPVLVTWSRSVDETPVWSPDGTRIAFLGKADGVPSVFVASATELAEVTRLSSPHLLVTSAPRWSPDSLQVLFSAQRLDTDDLGVYVAEALGTGERPLLEDANAYAPTWSPDGRWVAFVREEAGSGQTAIWVMRPDGIDQALVVGGLVQAGSIDWQPVPVVSPVVSADAVHVYL